MKVSGITDIHCHMLPSTDDGAADMEAALLMLDEAYAEGIRRIILTPHFQGGYYEVPAWDTKKTFVRFADRARQNHADMEFYLGNEIYYYRSIPEWIEEGRVCRMAESSYILLEFSPLASYWEIRDAVRYMVSNGYYPILAHAERYRCLFRKEEQIKTLIEMGAYIQVNAASVIGEGLLMRWFTRKLIRKDMIHFIATDAHGCHSRKPKIRSCAEYLAKHYGQEMMERLLMQNPQKIIENNRL